MSRTNKNFASVKELDQLIAAYFTYDVSENQPLKSSAKRNKQAAAPVEKTTGNKSEQPTFTGLAYFLGFNSRQEFEACEAKGKYSVAIKRARLRIEALYEEKLHTHSSGGAVFALKSMGWNERTDKPDTDTGNHTLKVEVTTSGPLLAASEKEVVL
jgi:hypothetical protein